MSQLTVKQRLLSSSIALVMGGGVAEATAQQDNQANVGMLEEVVVTGIRASLDRAMDIKRDANGVVDAISAEDIGKFPDTNLAESLQRISGVSIDRQNNEGSRVTVRGFGPDFNLVTLNGRSMPASQIGFSSAPATRSFDFANLASESVSGVQVYKTGKADVASGGIGSTINISTPRPLNIGQTKATVGVKAVHEASVEAGDDVTPEISGLFSTTMLDDKLGVLVAGSYQERHNREQNAQIDGWVTNGGLNPAAANVTDNRAEGVENYFYPQNTKFDVADHERTRTNAQATVQFQPVEEFTATLDYFYADFEDNIARNQFGVWFNGGGNVDNATIDENGSTTKTSERGGSYDYFGYNDTILNETDSVGLNVEWQATENLSFEADWHSSTATAEGADDGNNSFIILGVPFNGAAGEGKTYDASSTEIPVITTQPNSSTFEPEQVGSNIAIANRSFMDTEIDEFQLSGSWSADTDEGLTSIDFGVAQKEMINRSAFVGSFFQAGGGNAFADAGVFSDLLTPVSTDDLFSELSGGGSSLPDSYFQYLPADVLARAEESGSLSAEFGPGDFTDDHRITEDIFSAFMQFNFSSDFNGMPFNAVAGIRYEDTDVLASSMQREALYVDWASPTEWFTRFADESSFSEVESSYDNFLPSLDTSLGITDDLIARFSYSQTITRSDLASMRGTTSVSANPKPGQRSASRGNPDLLPYSSDNIDLSLEWYYGEGSYASIGYFDKRVDNFLVTEVREEALFGLRDPAAGDRAAEAAANVGPDATIEEIYYETVDLGYAVTMPDGVSQGIRQDGSDPLINWQVQLPSNGEDAHVWGYEIALQHMFWDTGFGVQANYTDVSSDSEVDRAQVGYQFALPGLSDSANLVGFYEGYGFQARIAYNWRDEFLSGFGASAGDQTQPRFTEAYGQVDLSVTYDVTDNISVFLEGLNVTEETQRTYSRYEAQLLNAYQYGARYTLGARWNF
ncbi:TonB-dependent receptor [Gilvimarinus xylanilyticus]|uniref:TonB-dependent receptor n=1 Tax=Gilvimarinus xylanilyticus TaxID=2944139 RepID=A0A9X2I3C4_9GAMM|nr:TonB-dependent receptor [Gilvimarinus xylanilyticus]MCP8900068.1 TonB-dependent receptor [Gilvimarinus xylanilyticus]